MREIPNSLKILPISPGIKEIGRIVTTKTMVVEITAKPILKNEQYTNLQIKTFDDLIKVCNIYKEIKEKGKKVVLNPLITCGNCEYCNSGSEHLCNKRIILGMNRPIERQGGFAEFVSIPEKNIYKHQLDMINNC